MDVTKENFREVFPIIRRSIEDAVFIAIDGEFTGLTLSHLFEPSLFDTPQLRYSKMKKSLTQFTLCQFGLSAFIPDDKNTNSFEVHTYNFYLFPQSFGPVDARFSCQASAIEFLRNHNFDFNKQFKKGVSYMNDQQKSTLYQLHKDEDLINYVHTIFLRQLDEKYIQPCWEDIEQFMRSDENVLEIKDAIPAGVAQYIFLKTVEQNFKNLSCSKKGNCITLMKSNHSSNDDSCCSYKSLYEELFWDAVGFKNVIDLLITNKKPIVGHNLLADLVFMFDKLLSELPDSVETFKKELHSKFPIFMDTKLIACNLRKHFKDVDFFDSTNLEDLYKVFTSPSALFYKLHSPHITHGKDYQKYKKSDAPHEAGYDAYMTGYVFLQMAHIAASKDVSSFDSRPSAFADLYRAVAEYENCIHVARASVKYLVMNGKDPLEEPAKRFIVTPKRMGMLLSPSKIAKDFIHFGSVDAIRLNSNRVLIGIFYRKSAEKVLQDFKNNEVYTVEKYIWYYNSDIALQCFKYGKYVSLISMSIGSGFFIWKKGLKFLYS